MAEPRRLVLPAVAGGLLLLAAAMSLAAFGRRLPLPLVPGALMAPDPADIRQMLVAYSLAPRMASALMAGAMLGLAGALLQAALRNPLASPSTLGIAAGANLALSVVTLWAPGLLALGREWVALGGGLAAAGLVLALAWPRRLAPLSVVLAGMVSVACGALAALLALFKTHYLAGLFIWGGGSLSQQDWTIPAFLAPRLALGTGLAVLLLRPLTLLGLDDAHARSLGVPVALVRLCALALGVGFATSVVSVVGVIGFIGLAAPALAHAAGARRLGERMLASAVIGAGVLWLTDSTVLLATGELGEMVPTGAVTALFGAPVLLWLLSRPRLVALAPPELAEPLPRHGRPRRVLAGLVLALLAVVAASLMIGRGLEGWSLDHGAALDALLPWRGPRAFAALAGGAMLALAGSLLQRMTGNPMASPEVLGVSAGAAFGLIAVLLVDSAPGRSLQLGGAALGAAVALAAILAFARLDRGAPERVLLAGVSLGAMFDALVTALLASGDPRAALLLGWMTGSTYAAEPMDAALGLGVAALGLASLPLLGRWLDIVPLGPSVAGGLGLPARVSHGVILLAAAGLSAAATLIVGPLTFVGLLGPHLSRRLGLGRALPELLGAALAGGLVMVLADWVGRLVAFPWQIPAGLAATFIGCPVLMLLLARTPSR
ncbi:Fe(3+)-hydroxamate ABC transporter permease FhuB [Ancylobacter sp. 6x-1]|uniref:Fe(3+)-hydroxamate ABC transporter permease FhuB n=1 Tax=Ancylobacter crimeensis TaxID=2579147 RepID=A0ABT0DB35_9HYPH|nr:Fe(3+)-hydroxamate ABC transporter permease FhuB [Ancylobacter crimeensis]MCK0197176.1 Fe(3+)-hydroxamate ABC transporter permease FhuB [Ancylobacter crimeensis]